MIERQFLLKALEFAEKRRGFCAPNPSVGAVVVKNGAIIGAGCHWQAGAPHAEVCALNEAGSNAKGAELYVTLEPCAHHGRTPPCVEAIQSSSVRSVIYAESDPHPLVDGKGANALLQAGMTTTYSPQIEITEFYRSYRYYIHKQRPWISAKIALSLDGKFALSEDRLLLTGEEAHRFTQVQRSRADALLTTVNSIISDDPQLNVRLAHATLAKPIYILDRQLRLPESCRVLQTAETITLFCGENASSERRDFWQAQGVKVVSVAENGLRLDLKEVIHYLSVLGYHDVWIECGSQLLQTLLEGNLLQTLYVYMAPKFSGFSARSLEVTEFDFTQRAVDIKIQSAGVDTLYQFIFERA